MALLLCQAKGEHSTSRIVPSSLLNRERLQNQSVYQEEPQKTWRVHQWSEQTWDWPEKLTLHSNTYCTSCLQQHSQQAKVGSNLSKQIMDEQKVVYTYNETLSSLEKEGNSDTATICMHGPWWHNVKWNKPVTKGQLYDSIYMRHLKQSYSRKYAGSYKGWVGRDNGELPLKRVQLQFGKMKKFWRWMVVKVAEQSECTLWHEFYI